MNNSLEVILKCVDACNFQCRYCYYFNNPTNQYRTSKKFLSLNVAKEIAEFLKKGCNDLNLDTLTIVFHGGEPLLQPIDDFERICGIFQRVLPERIDLRFCLQTNGSLITTAWKKIFQKYHISVGISLDGSPECHNQHRVNKKEQGTYFQVVKGLRILQKNSQGCSPSKMSTLSVINPTFSAKNIYHHFVIDLNLSHMDFLLPDFTHDTIHQLSSTNQTIASFGKFLCDLFDAWATDDNPLIKIRLLKSIMYVLMNKEPILTEFGPALSHNIHPVITIDCDGRLSPDDALISIDQSLFDFRYNINNISLLAFLSIPLFKVLRQARNTIPTKCKTCIWHMICGGGFLIHRYSQKNSFNNPSVYCQALRSIYKHIFSYLVEHGIDMQWYYEALSYLRD